MDRTYILIFHVLEIVEELLELLEELSFYRDYYS